MSARSTRPTRYFLDIDFDSRTYLIPVGFRKDWNRWLRENEEVYRARVPDYAVRVRAVESLVEFELPTVRNVPIIPTS